MFKLFAFILICLAALPAFSSTSEPKKNLPFTEIVPQGLTVSDLYSRSLLLEWDSVPGASSYSIYDIGCQIGRSKTNLVQFNGMLPESLHKLQVVAHNAAGEKTKHSEVASVRTLPKGTLATPERLQSISTGANSVTLRWGYVAAADQYEINLNGSLYTTAKVAQVEVSGLSPYTPYEFSVKATNAKGEQSKVARLMLTTAASPGETIRLLIDRASKGESIEENLNYPQEVKDWIRINREAIQGTGPSPFNSEFNWGRCTIKSSSEGMKMFFHIWNWPEGGKLLIPGVVRSPRKAYLLGTSKVPVGVKKKSGDMEVSLPERCPEQYSVTLVVEMK